MDRVLFPCWSHFLVVLAPFDPSQPLYKRRRHDTGPLSHRVLVRILTISTTFEMSKFPPTPSYDLGGGVAMIPSYTLWVLGISAYTNPHTASPSHPVGTNPFKFAWSSDNVPNFSSRGSGTKAQSIPSTLNHFTFGILNLLASIPSSILVLSSNPSVGLGRT